MYVTVCVALPEPEAPTGTIFLFGGDAVYDPASGEFLDVPIYWRPDLEPGARIAGPAILAENDTSTVVSPVFDAQIDKFGYIELIRRQAE